MLGLLALPACSADSISVTYPGAGTPALTGWTGNRFAVSYSGADIAEVCYIVDAYGLYNPGIDAPTTLGCSIAPPYSVEFNSFWYLNGPHQVVATAYNVLGAVVATSAAVPFSTANPCPILDTVTAGCVSGFNPSMTVTTGTPLTSNWSRAVTVTPTLAGSLIGTDSLTFNFFIDGILQQSITNSTATATGTLYSTQFQNGPHNVCVQVSDKTTRTHYDGPVGNSGIGTEWCRSVTFANGSTASQAQLNAHEIFLAPGRTFKLTARILNTDGTASSAANPVFMIAPAYINTSGGGASTAGNLLPSASVATVNSTTGVITAVGSGAALINAMTPTISITDLVIHSSLAFAVSSAAHPFTPAMTGWVVNITGGFGWRAGAYQITAVDASGIAILGVPPLDVAGAPGLTGGKATTGPTRQAWVYVWPTNTLPSFGSDGSIQPTYDPSRSMFVNSMFSSLLVLQNDQPYNSPNGTGNCGTGFPCGISVDFGVSGFNTFEFGMPPSFTITGKEPASYWNTSFTSYLAAAEANGLNLNPKFRGIVIGNGLTCPECLWALTYGPESSPNFMGSSTAMQYVIQQYIATGKIIGMSTIDEITSAYGYNPLQGPLTFSTAGTTQSALESITAQNNGTCAATLSPNSPPITFIGSRKFIIHGSATPGMNSVAPSLYTVLFPGGVAAAASVSGGVVTVKITNPGANSYVPPQVSLVGGGGTYKSATAVVNSSGQVTGVVVTGSAGYITAPMVLFSGSKFVSSARGYTYGQFAFACPGVANGVYNARNDPGLTVEPFGHEWYANNTDYMHYDSWAKWRTQTNAAANGHFWFTHPGIGLQEPLGFANWGGNPSYPGAQAIGAINSIADAGDLYWPTGYLPYINSRRPAINLEAMFNQGYHYRSLYGAYNPSKPFLGLTTATSTYAGFQGYPVSVTSCVGNTITFSAPHRITNVIPGITRLWITGARNSGRPADSCNNNFIVLAAPTPTTLTVLLGATNFASTGNTANGGTATFEDGSALPLVSINAAGVPNSTASSNVQANSQIGYLGGDMMTVAAWSANNSRKRGQTFTLSGVAGKGAENFNYSTGGHTFLLLPENLNLSRPPAFTVYGTFLFYREVPALNATGGTAIMLPDFNYRKGVSGAADLSDLNPGWAFGSFIENLLTRASGTRVYKIMRGRNGYSDQLGFTDGSELKTFASRSVGEQPYMNQHFEDGVSVPTFHAINHGALMANRLAKYILQPALNSPDTGMSWIPCAARAGSYGDTMFCLNASDGTQTVTFDLSPYLKSGQRIIRYVVNDHSILMETIAAGTKTDTPALQPLDAVFYVFPIDFARELQPTVIAARAADVTNATKVAVRYAYDRYYLDSAIGSVYDCGAAACTPPWDRNIGNVYYRLIYLGADSRVLATSDVQTF